jgi:hypothetical protein
MHSHEKFHEFFQVNYRAGCYYRLKSTMCPVRDARSVGGPFGEGNEDEAMLAGPHVRPNSVFCDTNDGGTGSPPVRRHECCRRLMVDHGIASNHSRLADCCNFASRTDTWRNDPSGNPCI